MKRSEEFLSKIYNESTRKSYENLFLKMRTLEDILNKDIDELSTRKEFLLLIEYCCKGNTYNSIYVKWSLLKRYYEYIGNNNIKVISNKDLNKIIRDNKEKDDNMKIIEKEYPTGKNAMCGDIIITNDNEYLLIGWDYHSQKAITIDVKKTTNNVKIFEYVEEIREKYANCRVIPAGEITMTFFE